MRTSDPFDQIIKDRIAALQAAQRLSAWSLIVTFLGDAIGPRGGIVSASALQALMQRLGIGHGAVRTAISRLSADGWIDRSREGRNSFYRLSSGVAETVLAAEQRIYAATSLLPSSAPRCLVLLPETAPDAAASVIEAAGGFSLAPRLWLVFSRSQALPASLLSFDATLADLSSLSLGPDLRARLTGIRHLDDMAALHSAYLPVSLALDEGRRPAPQDAMALRCLMIHEWRRVALRVPAVPSDLAMPDDPESQCRTLIAEIYNRLLAPSETWLDLNATTPSGPLPSAGRQLAWRFGGR